MHSSRSKAPKRSGRGGPSAWPTTGHAQIVTDRRSSPKVGPSPILPEPQARSNRPPATSAVGPALTAARIDLTFSPPRPRDTGPLRGVPTRPDGEASMHANRPYAFLVSTTGCARDIRRHMGSADYSYVFVLEALKPVLERLGTWRVVDRPESQLAHAAARAEAEGFRPVHLPCCRSRAPISRRPSPRSSSPSGNSPHPRPRLQPRYPPGLAEAHAARLL